MSLVKEEQWTDYLEALEGLGASHVTINTMGCGFSSPTAHIEALTRFARLIKVE
jgi:hypothetical protein